MLNAIHELYVLMREEALAHERPIALNTAVIANSNRDTKKNKKGYDFKDFCFYLTKKDKFLPAGRPGACALQLQEAGKYPSWALFCFKELMEGASKTYRSNNCALVADNAIILNPEIGGGSVKGFLIAQESASETIIEFTDMRGEHYSLAMPEISTKVIAQEDIEIAMSY